VGHWYNPPPPQPAAVHLPPNAAARSNIPPNPIGPGTLFDAIRSMWPPETWAAQSGDTIAAQFAAPFVPPVAIAATNPAVLAAIRQSWPSESWDAQRGAHIANFFASVVTGPIAYPSRPAALAVIRGLWDPEQWYAQSESGIASGLAQVQLPPIYTPNWYGDTLLMLVSTWPREDWPAQTGPKSAGWYPKPAIYTPRPVPHLEGQQWTQEQWSAQTAPRIATLFSTVPAALPYINRSLAAALRSIWPQEDWPAQTFPDIASGQAPIPPPVPRSPPQFTISLWPPEFWGTQLGTRGAAILATPQLLTFMPWVVGELQNVAIAQLESLFAATITLQYVYSGAPPLTVVYQSIPKDTLVFTGEAVTLEISLGPQHGPSPTPIVESILISNIPIVVSILPPNKTVIQ